MTNEQIKEELGYFQLVLSPKKREAIENAIDIVDGLDGVYEDFFKYKEQLVNDNPIGSPNYFIVTNMIYEFGHILEKNFGKFEEWHNLK